jgi:hypothetical protein
MEQRFAIKYFLEEKNKLLKIIDLILKHYKEDAPSYSDCGDSPHSSMQCPLKGFIVPAFESDQPCATRTNAMSHILTDLFYDAQKIVCMH